MYEGKFANGKPALNYDDGYFVFQNNKFEHTGFDNYNGEPSNVFNMNGLKPVIRKTDSLEDELVNLFNIEDEAFISKAARLLVDTGKLKSGVDKFPFDLTKLINEEKVKLDDTLKINPWYPYPFENAF